MGWSLVSIETDSGGEAFFSQAKNDKWETPPKLTDAFAVFDPIDTDPCAGPATTIGRVHNWTIEDDGFSQPWTGTTFINPPFSAKSEWLTEVLARLEAGEIRRAYVVLPDSTDVKSWWHGLIVPNANRVWFPEGRIKYRDAETQEIQKSPTFGTSVSMYGEEPPARMLDWFRENGWLVKEDAE